MSEAKAETSFRREARFRVTRPESTSITLVIEEPVLGQPHVFHGTVADVSPLGLRLTLDAKIPTGTKVRIQLCVPDCHIDMITYGEVRWVQPRDESRWSIGCSLGEPISTEILETLASVDVVDRRHDERKHVCCAGGAKWELTAEPLDVRLLNYSASGCCLLFPEEVVNPSDRLMLVLTVDGQELDSGLEARLQLRLMWHQLMEDGFAVGCSFISRNGYLTLRGFLEGDKAIVAQQRQLALSKQSRQTSWRWVAIAAFVLLGVKGIELVRRDTAGKSPRPEALSDSTINVPQSAERQAVKGSSQPLRNVSDNANSESRVK